MKYKVFTVLLAFIVICSCGKKSTEPETEPEKHELVGTWEWQKSTYYSPTIVSPDTTWIEEAGELLGMTLEIKDNDTYDMAITGLFEMTFTGTWDVSGSTFTTTILGESIEMEYDISGDVLMFTYFQEADPDFDEPEAWVEEEYKRAEIINDLLKVTTVEVSAITDTSAQCGGTITDDGGATVTARGVCWSTDQNPTKADDTTNDGTGVGSFTSNITGLTPGTTYYVRAYATNSAGTGYGSTMSFTTEVVIQTGTVTDIDGNVYQTVRIGDQWWMAENLKVTHYRNGDPIAKVTSEWEWDDLTTSAYCNYDNDDENADTYGSLYNWYAVDDSLNIAPEGWHVPTDEEWKQMEMYLGMSQSEADDTGARGTDEGKKLKSMSGWSSNSNGTDLYGFSALPGGVRRYNGNFELIGTMAFFWSSTVSNNNYAWFRGLWSDNSLVLRHLLDKEYGRSVRCVMD